jgi:hypothetical protein
MIDNPTPDEVRTDTCLFDYCAKRKEECKVCDAVLAVLDLIDSGDLKRSDDGHV